MQNLKKTHIFIAIFFVSFLIKIPFIGAVPMLYDETAYAHTAATLARDGGWFNLYGSWDLFFFPPLFNYMAALLIKIGFESLMAVRFVSIFFSSFIPAFLFLLSVDSGLSRLSGVFAALIWILSANAMFFSIGGQVETTMLAFLLFSVYFLMRSLGEKGSRFAVLSSLSLALSLWIKETTLGFLPVFLFFYFREKEFKKMAVWIFTFFAGTLPLIVQSFMPSRYDLFYELTNLSRFNNISLDSVLGSLSLFFSINPIIMKGFTFTSQILLFLLILYSIKNVGFEGVKRNFILLFSALSLSIFVPFFTVYPRKFPYYLLPVFLFILFFIGNYFESKRKLLYIFLPAFILGSISIFSNYLNNADTKPMIEQLKYIEKIGKHSKIAMALPRTYEYVAVKNGIDLQIVEVPAPGCYGNPMKCIEKTDYYFGSDYYLKMLFCRNWSVDNEFCDLEKFGDALKRLKVVRKWPGNALYKVEK